VGVVFLPERDPLGRGETGRAEADRLRHEHTISPSWCCSTTRISNCLLGGTDNLAADRAAGDQMPHLAEFARLSRRFHVRAATLLTARMVA
jgi:membrane-anchored protein YejM (alkaline phosphatase superfamily)